MNCFSDKLKQSELIPVYKKLDPLDKENHRPVSLLSHASKVFERIIHKQINTYMEDKISNYVTGFRKPHGSQHSLVIMLERWKQAIDKGEYISVMYMDLSKAFDTINYDLLLAKVRAHGLSASALNLLYSYLKYRKQKVVINNKTSSSEVVIAGVPQGSIDGPLLFNLFINDLSLFVYTAVLSNYADDNNLYAIGNDKEETKRALVKDFQTVINLFYENYLIVNTEKCHYKCMGVEENETSQISSQQKIINSKEVEILEIKIDRKLSFYQHIKNISKKAGQKLSALLRISPYLKNNKKKVIYNTMIKSQFNY